MTLRRNELATSTEQGLTAQKMHLLMRKALVGFSSFSIVWPLIREVPHVFTGAHIEFTNLGPAFAIGGAAAVGVAIHRLFVGAEKQNNKPVTRSTLR